VLASFASCERVSLSFGVKLPRCLIRILSMKSDRCTDIILYIRDRLKKQEKLSANLLFLKDLCENAYL
jgi:hypothetical protein